MKKKKTYIIVGGVAGGATAAAKLRREDEHAKIIMFEQGPYVSFANCGLPYYIGGEIKKRNDLLLMTPQLFWDKYRIKVLTSHEVLTINTKDKTVLVKNKKNQFKQGYDKLILSQGAGPIMPPIKGINLPHVFSLRNIPDMDRIHRCIKNKDPKKAVVIGGGFIGLEMAEAFYYRGLDVTVVEMMPHILPPMDKDMAFLFTESIKRKKFKIITNNAVKEIKKQSVVLTNNKKLSANIVLVSAGVKPEIELAKKAGLKIGKTGGVIVNKHLQSSDPHIYAVGDMIEIKNYVTNKNCRIPLAGPANRQGRIAAINITRGQAVYHGALGTSIVKVFEQAAAISGLTEKAATKLAIKYKTTMTSNDSHAGYYPRAKPVRTKIIYQQKTGRLLGAQVIGGDGIDKRIDVLATAIYARLTVKDLEQIDLAYAPPFGSANDPINISGFVSAHILKGDVITINHPQECPKGAQIIDVRKPDEIKKTGILKGAINLPFPEIRDRLKKIDPHKPIVLYCAKGQRGYFVFRILKANGFKKLFNINGGFPAAQANGWAVSCF